jgi:hypothetical protein
MHIQARAAVDDAAKQTKLVAKLKQQVASLTASASSSSSASSASASSSAAGGSAVERELQVYKSLVNCGVCKDTRKEVWPVHFCAWLDKLRLLPESIRPPSVSVSYV